MTETKPKRRWFRFSLRTLFVLVTVAGVILSYGLRWAKERRELALPREPPGKGPLMLTKNVCVYSWQSGLPPWYLRLFDTCGYDRISLGVPDDTPQNEIDFVVAKTKSLFPEAMLETIPMNPWRIHFQDIGGQPDAPIWADVPKK